MPAPRRLVKRSGDLKRAVIDFALTNRAISRIMQREMHKSLGRRARGGEGEWINFIDYFILQHRLTDGKTVVERFVEQHPQLPEDERAMLLGWREVVEGVFEVRERRGDAITAFNLVDELTYRISSNAGKAAFEPTPPGAFILGRIVPVADEWLVSGSMYSWPADQHEAAHQFAADLGLRRPKLVFRNPEKLKQAFELQRIECQAFRQFFGSDLVIVPGSELQKLADDYWRFRQHEFVLPVGKTAAELAKEQGQKVPELKEKFPEDLLKAETVGIVCDDVEGMYYFRNLGTLAEVFERPELVKRPRYRRAVQDYLRDPDTEPLPLRRLAEQNPEHASQVLREVLKQPDFSWERDGEALLRKYKPRFYEEPPLPSVVPASSAQARAHSR
ncbi:MAG: hypothetical protein HY332_00590 [Chloroflexi bacterium]|nr:hypothetical protein [Chloroflexota bacterium]